jgi:hypothetical protein
MAARYLSGKKEADLAEYPHVKRDYHREAHLSQPLRPADGRVNAMAVSLVDLHL